MSEISLYPQGIDIFTTKVDSTNGDDGDYIMAEHMNRAQNAITAIELALGTNPQGDSADVTQRLGILNNNKALSVPRIAIYSGNPISINGSTTKEAAARCFSYLSIALLSGIDPFTETILDARDVIEETNKISATVFYGTIDAGVSTSNFPTADIESMIDRWSDIGAKGIYFSNFGYDTLTSRERQNTIIGLAHARGLRVIVSSTNIDHVFSVDDVNGMNPTNIQTTLAGGDGYLSLGYAVQGSYYQNAAELQELSGKMVSYRSAYGISMYGVGYTDETNPDLADRMYYYGQVVAMLYSLDGFHVVSNPVSGSAISLHKTFPVVGGYYDTSPRITTAGNVVSRYTSTGILEVDFANHTYNFKNIRIPLGFIDFNADGATINADKLSGNIPDGVGIDVIGRINNDTSGYTIASGKIDLDGSSVIDAINLVASGMVKIDSNAISNLSAAHIEDIVIQVLGEQLETELNSGELDANFRRLMTQFISAQNAYFTAIKGETGTFAGLNAGVLTAGYLSSGLIATDSITSDKLTIHANAGVNKWTATVVLKDVGVITNPSSANVLGKDIYRTFEATDSATLVASDYIGSSLTNYMLLWETNVVCTGDFTVSASLTANSYASLFVNGQLVKTVSPGTTAPYSVTLHAGWNVIQIYQDHNTETSCTCGIGIKFSQYALQTENGTNPNTVSRVDAYSARTTQIIGDIIKTGSITTKQLDADEVSAGLVSAGMLQAIEAYIQRLEVEDGSFRNILTDILSSKVINANNVAITSEAAGISGDTGILRIDNGGLIVCNVPKEKIAVIGDAMTNTAIRVYRTAHIPVCDSPAPVFKLRDKTTSAETTLARDSYALIYEYGQVTLDEGIDLANKDVIADYSYYAQYYPVGSRVVRIDRDGISISNDGGRPGTWTTKLDGNRLYVGTVDIENLSVTNEKVANIDAGKITTGTLTASESVTVSAGAGAIVLDGRGLTSATFSIGTDGNATFSGTVTAAVGSKIANWNIGANTIYDNLNKIVLDSSVPSIDIDGGKVVVGKYDATNYGIKAIKGLIGNVQIDEDGLAIGSGSIVDTRDPATQKLHISSNGVIAGNISATSGTINGISITPEGIAAFTTPAQPDIIQNIEYITNVTNVTEVSNSYNNYYLQPNSIRVLGDEAVIIDTGTLVVKDNTQVNRIILGKLSDTLYGLKLDLLSGRYIQLDKSGMRVYDGVRNTVDINSAGSITVTGTINAEAGTLKNLTVSGDITAGDVTINTSGISGTGYSLNASGITATAGAIAGWTIGNTTISKGSVVIDSAAENIRTTGAILGKYDATHYGIQATSGQIGGWNIQSGALTTPNITIDSTNEQINIAGLVTMGKYNETSYGIKSGDAILNGTGISGTGYSLDVNGIMATKGSIGGWTIGDSALSSGNITIDATTDAQKISIGTNILLNNDGSATLGKLSVGADGTISTLGGFSVDADGKITATSGTIGGWTINIEELAHGQIHFDTTNDCIWMGSASISTANIRLNSSGTATIGKLALAADGSLDTGTGFRVDTVGRLVATGGIVGGFALSNSTLSVNTNSVILDSIGYKLSFNNNAAIFGQYLEGKYGIKIGNFIINGTDAQMYVGSDYASSRFKIDLSTGNATLNSAMLQSGSVAGWDFSGTTLSKNNVTLDSTGSIKLGATNQVVLDSVNGINVASGKFTVDLAGHMVAQDAIITGTINASLGGIGGWTIGTSAITAGNITLDSSGSIKAGTSTDRVEIDGTGVKVIKDGNVVGSAITPDGIYGQLLVDQTIVGTKFDKVAPAIPTGISVEQVIEQTATSEFINLSVTWSAVNDTDNDLAGYKVYLRENTGLYYPVASVGKAQPSYIIRNVKGNTQYYVAVSSYDLTGNESVRSSDAAIMTTKDTVAPAKVTGLGTVDGPKMFYVKWNPVVYNWNPTTGSADTTSACVDLDYYEVQRKTELTGSTIEDWSTINRTYSTGIIDKDVNYEYDYSYRVRPVDLSGNYPQTGGISEWATIAAGKASKIGSADIVAGSITADVLNVGSMVKSINPMKTMLWHFDGVTTSTQDARPISIQGGSWSDGKFGDGIALEEATVNLVSQATNGNAGFKNGILGWTVDGAEYQPSGGMGGSNDGFIGVTDTKTLSIALDTVVGQSYAVSVYGRSAVFTEPTNLIVIANGVEIMDSSVYSEWKRIIYVYTADSTSTTLTFKSSTSYTACVDNVQVENRGFVTAFTESYTLEGGTRQEGCIKYASDRLNPPKGIVAFWYKPNRSGGSQNTQGQVLWMWGEESVDNSKGLYVLEITNDNRPRFTIAGNGWSHVITHESSVNPLSWNEITIRWAFDDTLPAESRYAEIFLNGTESMAKIDLSALTPPTMNVSTFTLGNHNDAGHSANGTFDEVRVDLDCVMDQQEKEEIISWYKSGSTFYDAASQIDADSQGISAANAKVTINNEGITVRDGMMKVVSDDGITLIGGGRINVNGINVGVVQSDNEIYDGNFSAPDTAYGVGDMYLTPDGIINYGAKYWRSRRSSPWAYDVAVMNATWNRYMVGSIINFEEVYAQLQTAYNTSIRANEAVSHTVESGVMQAMYASGVAAVIGANASAATNFVIASKLLWIPGQQVYVDSGANRELLTIANVNPANNMVTFATNLTKSHVTGAFVIEKTLFDDTLEDELTYQIDKAANDKFDEWHSIGLSAERYNDANGNIKYVGVKIDPEAQILEYVPHTLNMWTRKFGVIIDPNTLLPVSYPASEELGVYGHTKYEVWPKDTKFGKTGYARLGVNTLHPDTTVDVSHQEVSVEQDLKNLVTYTDGLLPEDTNWKQHIFSFYAKWENKPEGSQAALTFQVDELVPNYTVGENNVATITPSFVVEAAQTANNQNDAIIGNTDFVGQKFQLAFGHATYPTPGDYSKYDLDSVRYASALPMQKVRYIRDWIVGGNTENQGGHWVEIAAIDMTSTDVALGKTVTANFTPDVGAQPLTAVTDGVLDTTKYVAAPFDSGAYYVQIDLGQNYTLSAINIRHYNAPGRIYHGTRTQISEDGAKWYDIWVYNPMLPDSGYWYEYAETAQGWTIGGVTGITPNPILVEEIFTATGETDAGKPHWVIANDGLDKGLDHAKYLSSSAPGDAMMIVFRSDSITDADISVLDNPDGGTVYIYVDGVQVGEADVSFPVNNIKSMPYKEIPAGNHIATLISTGEPGINTTSESPRFMLNATSMYDYRLISSDYSTIVTYEETDPTTWNKVTIKPEKSNSKKSGEPLVTAEKVPIKYRVVAKLVKPEGDPLPCSVLITDIQAELGQNESFSRVNYGAGGTPAYQVSPYNPEIPYSGITAQHLQVYNGAHIQETGIYERHIADYQITTQKIARSAITTDTIAAGNVTYDKLAVVNRQRLQLNVTLDDYPYPVILTPNTDPKVRYIPMDIQEDSEEIHKNGQLLFPGDDYTITRVPAAQHVVTLGVANADGHTTQSIRLGSTASAVTDGYNGMLIVLTGGTGMGQSKVIVSYDGTTKDAVVDSLWTIVPGADTQYRIIDDTMYAFKIQFLCDISATDKVWAKYWQKYEERV